jgi:hypothetical protein
LVLRDTLLGTLPAGGLVVPGAVLGGWMYPRSMVKPWKLDTVTRWITSVLPLGMWPVISTIQVRQLPGEVQRLLAGSL